MCVNPSSPTSHYGHGTFLALLSVSVSSITGPRADAGPAAVQCGLLPPLVPLSFLAQPGPVWKPAHPQALLKRGSLAGL